jgi:FemAB-related protein (PEP-CTERM system-associated)
MRTPKIGLQTPESASSTTMTIRVHEGRELDRELPRLEAFLQKADKLPLSRNPRWLAVLRDGLRQIPYCLEAVSGEKTQGLLPLVLVRSLLFGRFLVSLPYLNHGGIWAHDAAAANALMDRAVGLAESLDVRYLELRHCQIVEHPALHDRMTSKIHMQLSLPSTEEDLWKQLDSKVRNQVRKGQKSGLAVAWGGQALLGDFFAVFSRNMRDLGTPTYGKRLFSSILKRFPDQAELCVVYAGATPVAGGLLLHGSGVTEVPSASSLRRYNPTCANMLLYWHLLERAIQRRQSAFDFGRSSRESSTYRFKQQWGAQESPAQWQYFVRKGAIGDMRPENPRYQRLIKIWRCLPVWLARLLGPHIVRGIP